MYEDKQTKSNTTLNMWNLIRYIKITMLYYILIIK